MGKPQGSREGERGQKRGGGAWGSGPSEALDILEEPGAGISPVAFGGGEGNLQSKSGLLEREADEIAELHQFRLAGFKGRQPLERFMDLQEMVVLGGSSIGYGAVIHIESFQATAMAQSPAPSGVVDEDVAHGFGGRANEMSAVIPARLRIAAQAEPGFVHKGGGLQRVSGRLVRHSRRRDATQFLVHQRQQFGGRVRIAPIDALEYERHITHGGRALSQKNPLKGNTNAVGLRLTNTCLLMKAYAVVGGIHAGVLVAHADASEVATGPWVFLDTGRKNVGGVYEINTMQAFYI